MEAALPRNINEVGSAGLKQKPPGLQQPFPSRTRKLLSLIEDRGLRRPEETLPRLAVPIVVG